MAEREKLSEAMQAAIARFNRYHLVSSNDGCWEWVSTRTHDGYARMRYDGRLGYAHRFAYELHVGPVPEGYDLDHLCRVRHCVNPAHLEPVTRQENLRRGSNGVLKTHCPQGHSYDEENTNYRRDQYGYVHRHCRACWRAYYHRRKR